MWNERDRQRERQQRKTELPYLQFKSKITAMKTVRIWAMILVMLFFDVLALAVVASKQRLLDGTLRCECVCGAASFVCILFKF